MEALSSHNAGSQRTRSVDLMEEHMSHTTDIARNHHGYDGSDWPHHEGLKWPHPSAVIAAGMVVSA